MDEDNLFTVFDPELIREAALDAIAGILDIKPGSIIKMLRDGLSLEQIWSSL